MQLVTPGGNYCFSWQMMIHNSRLVNSFINIMQLYMNMINRKQLYTNQTRSRWKKVNKMRHLLS